MTTLAMVFPGQGSQAIGMLNDVAATNPIVAETFHEASEQLGYDLWQIVQQGPAEKLNTTAYTQPAILTASVAIWRILNQHIKLQPTFMAGHSLGEYSALVCANVVPFKEAVKIVSARGEFMQQAVANGIGAMAAIVGLPIQKVQEVCEESAGMEVVSAVNFNSPEQVVIAGHASAVERACTIAKTQGAKLAMILPVSVPAHCELMRPAAERLAQKLKAVEFKSPTLPVINNVDVQTLAEADMIRNALIRQLYSPVRWVETIQLMAKNGIHTIIECGPGRVLSGLIKRIEPTITCLTTGDIKSLQDTIGKLS